MVIRGQKLLLDDALGHVRPCLGSVDTCKKIKYKASCSKLTTSSKLTTLLVKVSLNYQKLMSQICQYFLLEKCEKLLASLIFSTKSFSVFGYKVIKHLMR